MSDVIITMTLFTRHDTHSSRVKCVRAQESGRDDFRMCWISAPRLFVRRSREKEKSRPRKPGSAGPGGDRRRDTRTDRHFGDWRNSGRKTWKKTPGSRLLLVWLSERRRKEQVLGADGWEGSDGSSVRMVWCCGVRWQSRIHPSSFGGGAFVPFRVAFDRLHPRPSRPRVVARCKSKTRLRWSQDATLPLPEPGALSALWWRLQCGYDSLEIASVRKAADPSTTKTNSPRRKRLSACTESRPNTRRT